MRYNVAKNIQGRISDGKGGYLSTIFYAQFVQLNGVKATRDVEISWNQVINEPDISLVGDNINMFLSSGTADSPIVIRDNYVQGAYGVNPETAGFSGGGIIVDGDSKVLADASGHISIFNNQVVATSNYGIAISSGHDVDVRNNRAVSTGLLPNGKRIAAANVGVYVWSWYRNTTTMFNNVLTSNVVGWVNAKGSMNNWWFPDCQAPNCQGNTALRGPITSSMEEAEFASWREKLRQRGLQIGASLAP